MRTMDWWLLTFLFSAILSLFFPLVPELFYLSCLFVLAIVICFYKPLRLLCPLLLGFCWIMYSANQYQNIWHANGLDPFELATKRQKISGHVITLPRLKGIIYRFSFRIDKINDKRLKNSIIVRLRWDNPAQALAQGQYHQLIAKIKPAHGFANPGAFSYQTWLRQKHIAATGYVHNKATNRLIDSGQSVRQQLFSQYRRLLPEHALAPLLLALSFGERSDITATTWQVFQATGTQHLIAISGLHLGLIASMSFLCFLWLAKWVPLQLPMIKPAHNLLLHCNLRILVISLSLLASVCYAYLAGFSLPTVRALVMLLLYWLVRALGIKITVRRWLLLALVALVIMTPFSLFSASFWLSVYAVCVIFMVLWRFIGVLQRGKGLAKKIKSLVIIQLALTLCLLPMSALIYGQISIAALPANLLAVPLMSLITIPLCLLSVLSLGISEPVAQLLMTLALQSVEIVWWWLAFLARQDWALLMLSQGQTHALALLTALLALKVFLFTNVNDKGLFYQTQTYGRVLRQAGRRLLILGKTRLTMLLFLFVVMGVLLVPIWRNISPLATKHWQVQVFDVGHGLAVLIKRGRHVILYDTGAAYPSGFNIAEAVILPYLQQQNITRIDKIIISHSDNDHAGGLPLLQQNLVIEQLISNQPSLNGDARCLQGKRFIWQGLSFRMLWPQQPLGRKNDHSCVIQVTDGYHKLLLTGDISRKVEKKLLASDIRSHVLIAPHHGSKGSSTLTFLQSVSPNYAIFSSGFLNQWSMPSLEVMQRYQQANIKTFTTANSGMVAIEFAGKQIVIKEYRRHMWPFWFAN
jgi:competence protein ComEC